MWCSDRCWSAVALVSRMCPGEDVELLLVSGETGLGIDWTGSRVVVLSGLEEETLAVVLLDVLVL